MNIWCHIVGINNTILSEFITKTSDSNYNIIDLNKINSTILNDNTMIQLFKQYQGFKNSKNDKYKDIDKKMTKYWDKNINDMIENTINLKKKNIIIGYSNHFRNINKRINIDATNRFIICCNKKDVKDTIKYNLEKHKDDIIRGAYPLENVDYEFIMNSRKKMEDIYIKNGYIVKTLDNILTILQHTNNISTNINKMEDGLWYSSTQPYNISSKIHPKKNDKIFAFTDMNMALLSSFKFDKNDIEKIYQDNIVDNKKKVTIKIITKKDNILDKLKQKRYIYYLDRSSFTPHEKGNMVKYFSQMPATILHMEKIDNVYDKFTVNDII